MLASGSVALDVSLRLEPVRPEALFSWFSSSSELKDRARVQFKLHASWSILQQPKLKSLLEHRVDPCLYIALSVSIPCIVLGETSGFILRSYKRLDYEIRDSEPGIS